ncbi:glycosyltransferase family 2 protein [Kaistella yonginensis]|uniref:glycosyltransferase family 2 protein n=1 Tax=Kaistella yonginensis TaxID=658267 RepID=UPI0025B5A072|nr:glycosyltransferase [Kaistella yonginensis]MDN3605676.1 glycosyltransferase [Kaistella yonginensis]
MAKLGIVIPYFKLTFFRECLESLATQTDQRFTVYIGNDDSPENPEDLLNEFEGKFTFSYKKFDDNLGGTSLTKQWERCIEMMDGEEWLMILGDDDCLSKNAVEEFRIHLRNIEKEQVNVVSFRYQQIDERSRIIKQFPPRPALENAMEAFCDKIRNITYTSLSQYIFRKSAFDRHQFLDLPLAWGSDDFAVLKIADNNMVYNIQAIVMVRMSKENISGMKTLTVEKSASLRVFYSKLFREITMNKRQADICSDLYFNLILHTANFWEFFYFFRIVSFKVSLNLWLYFAKVSTKKLIS